MTERKLQKLKKESKLVDALAQAKERSLRDLLNQSQNTSSSGLLSSLDDSLLDCSNGGGSGNAAVQEVFRHLQPVQAVTAAERVQILQYDQLELSLREQATAEELAEESSANEQPERIPFKRVNH